MIDWEDIINTDDPKKLHEAKLWLFHENIRLTNERRELEESKERFLNERVRLRNEMNELSHRTSVERKRLKEESIFFEKKMAILKDGFAKLDADRQMLESEKKKIKRMYASLEEELEYNTNGHAVESIVELMFKNINNRLALRKRYRDLVKIFHPDNAFGDTELMLAINKEYLKRKEEL